MVGGTSAPSLTNTYTINSWITQGVTYSFKYRAFNVNVAGDFSPIGYLVAAQRPSQPSAPEYVISDDTSVTLGFRPPSSNGGSIITKYVLKYSDFATLNWQIDTTYTDNSMSYILAVSSGLVTSYQKYRFRIYWENAFETSDYLDELALAIAIFHQSEQHQQNLKAVALMTSISIKWVAPSEAEPIIGYLVYIADISGGGSYTLAYDGSSNPIRLTYTAMLLTPGKSYGFKVLAINFNGNGPLGSEAIFESWEAPKGLQVPTIGQVTETQISITWSVPVSNGGCSTTAFKLWMDDATGGSLVETAASDIKGKPYLRSYNIVFTDPTATGKSFRIRLEAFNSVGSVLSPIVSVVLAQVPATPTTGPTLDLTNTNAYQIGVNWSTVSDIGGSSITSYELQMAPPGSDTFISLVGYDRQYLDTSYIATQNITKGKDHRFRYRAQN